MNSVAEKNTEASVASKKMMRSGSKAIVDTLMASGSLYMSLGASLPVADGHVSPPLERTWPNRGDQR